MSFEYVNFQYGVNACIGRRVTAYGKPGTIVRDFGNYIGIILDDEPNSFPGCYHPTDGIIYGEVVDYTPPKISAKQAKAKGNYQEYLDADYGHGFAEWMGIRVPEIEYNSRGECRMYRTAPYHYSYHRDVEGKWCKTKKEAKASYKEALAFRRALA